MKHEAISRDRLLKRVLDSAGVKHKLSNCPLCSKQLDNAVCRGGAEIHYERGSGKPSEIRRWSCESCGIVWELEMFNSIEEKCSGAVEEREHHLSLTGYRNCYCRSVAVREFRFHKGEGHAQIGYSAIQEKQDER